MSGFVGATVGLGGWQWCLWLVGGCLAGVSTLIVAMIVITVVHNV